VSVRDDVIMRQGAGENARSVPLPGPALGLVVVLAMLVGCTENLANIRTLASSLQTATSDTESIVAADNASCQQNLALQKEYKLLVDPSFVLPSCDDRAAVLASILAENKALQAYGGALASLADDQFVTTDTDAKVVTDTLTKYKMVSDPVVEAVDSVFSAVETAALNGYRQRELKKVMVGPPAEAFKTIMSSYASLSDQYTVALHNEKINLALIQAGINQKHGGQEPVAVAELAYRFAAIQLDIDQKTAALDDYSRAIAELQPAFDAAVMDLTHPSPKEIYDSVKSFASTVKDAHDKLKKAFG
jgi:hypothetical protein